MKVEKWIEGNFASRCRLQVIAALWLQVGLLRVAGWVDFSLGQNLSSLEPERSAQSRLASHAMRQARALGR